MIRFKRHFSTLLILFLAFGTSLAQNRYKYFVDLTQVENDRVPVSLVTPPIAQKEITFYMPKIIPGTYAIADYGRFISDFKAFDAKGKELKVVRADDNSWVIKKANKVSRISYWVDDSFDYEGEGPEVFWPAGTNIEENTNFIINSSGFFGYFSGMKTIPFELNVIRDDGMYGGTGLIRSNTMSDLSTTGLKSDGLEVSSNEKVDVFVADNYDHLVDSPLMYTSPDSVIMKVANTEVLIISYSPNKMISSEDIASTIESTLQAQQQFLGGKLPVDKYAFIFYFTDQPIQSYGALEHSYSSLYFMPESTIEEMEQTMRDFAAHEFFHIISPLTIHSEEIHHFDFNEPKMSRHLWLYEGVTEYFAGLVQVQSGLVDVGEYIGMMRQKLIMSTLQYNDSLAFTDLSLGALGEHEDQYANVYQKGALIGLCLDLKLRSLSGGKTGLRDIILKLSEKYGKGNYFNDPELFDIIAEISYPEIREFFSKYVEKGEPIPYHHYFELAGITYQKEQNIQTLSMGFSQPNIDIDMENGLLKIKNEEQLNDFGKALGLQNDDKLVKMNDTEIPPLGPSIQSYITGIMGSLAEGKEFSISVLRVNGNGEEEEVRLAANNFKIDAVERFVIVPMREASEDQLALRKAWLTSLSPN